MFNFTPFAISGLIISVIYLPLFLFFIIKGKTKITKIYSFHIFSILIWGLGSFLIGSTKNTKFALLFWQFAYIGVLFISVSFQHTVLLILNKKQKIYTFFIYFQAIFFSILILEGLLIRDVKLLFNSIYFMQSNSLITLSFINWILIICYSHLQLIQNYSKVPQMQLIVLMGSIIGFWCGVTNYLPVFNINFYPLGNFFIPLHSLIISYAISKQELWGIKVVISKSIAYSLSIACISLLYLLFVFATENSVQHVFGYQSFIMRMTMAFALGLTFVPLRNRIQKIADKFFLKGTPEEIARQNQQLKEEITRSEKYKTLSILSSGVAHEVKNPLTAIKTFAEYLPQKLDDKEFLQKFSKIVGKEVDRIDKLVHHLLEYSKPSNLIKKPTDIHALTKETLDILHSKFLAQRIDVTNDFLSSPLTLNIDPVQIRQALLNLFLNAIDAMPNGGTLTVTTQKASNTFSIVIRDTGCGISPDDLPHIFDPFFSKKDSGTGLGLAITQSIIEKHGGKIKVTSALGQGTEFRIDLPV